MGNNLDDVEWIKAEAQRIHDEEQAEAKRRWLEHAKAIHDKATMFGLSKPPHHTLEETAHYEIGELTYYCQRCIVCGERFVYTKKYELLYP